MKASITLCCWSVFMTISGLLSAQQDIPKGAYELKQRNTPKNLNKLNFQMEDLPNPGLISIRHRSLRPSIYTFDNYRVSERTLMNLILRDNPSARVFVKKAYKKNVTATVLSTGAFVTLLSGTAISSRGGASDSGFTQNEKIGLVCFFAGLGIEGIGLYQRQIGHKNLQQAIQIYNDGLSDGTTRNPAFGYRDRPELQFGVQANGLGICLHF